MDILRRRLLEKVTKQSDLLEIFNAIDQDHSGRITFEEFRRTLKSLRIGINDDAEIKLLFQQFDKTNNGEIDFFEFLQELKPTMNERRQRAALNMFQSMDMDKDGKLTLQDLRMKYAVQIKSSHKNSTQNIDQILQNLLKKMDTHGQEDGVIEKDEFLTFCSILSATVKEDIYFEHALRTLFDLRL